MHLYTNWKTIIRKAWSIKFIILAGLLSAMEVILPLYIEDMNRGLFAFLSFVATSGAFISRLVAQKSIKENDEPE